MNGRRIEESASCKKMKTKKVCVTLILIVILFFGNDFRASAEGIESVSVYHSHNEDCGETPTTEWRESVNNGYLRTVRSDTCACGGHHDYYQFDCTCTCGASWHTTGHACSNSPYGSNAGNCSNYKVINCSTLHNHPSTTYACGLNTSSVVANLNISSSTGDVTKEVTLTGTVSDIDSITNLKYNWSNGETEKTVTVSENGTYELAISGDNIQPASISIIVANIDSTPPTVASLSADITEPTAGNVTLTVTGTDEYGLATAPYSWDGSVWSATNTKMVTTNGTYTAYVKDAVGNVSQKSITINNIDKTAPDITLVADVTDPTPGDIILTVDGTDAFGLATEPYSWDGSTWGVTNTKAVTTNGTYTAYVKDAVGNVAEKSIIIANIDKEAPNIEIKANTTAPTSGTVTLTVIGTDEFELATEPYSFDGSTWGVTNTKTVTTNGTYTAYVKDAVGNIAEKSITISNIYIPQPVDREPPIIKDLFLSTDKLVEEVVITVVVEEANVSISWDGGVTWGNATTTIAKANTLHTVMVKDEAGNTASRSIEVNNIIVPVKENEQEKIEEEVITEEIITEEEPASEVVLPPAEPKEEETELVVELEEVKTEEIQGSISVEEVLTVAAPVTGGGCFVFFFAFWLLGRNATLYALDCRIKKLVN